MIIYIFYNIFIIQIFKCKFYLLSINLHSSIDKSFLALITNSKQTDKLATLKTFSTDHQRISIDIEYIELSAALSPVDFNLNSAKFKSIS